MLTGLAVAQGGGRGTWCALPCLPNRLYLLVLPVSLLTPLI